MRDSRYARRTGLVERTIASYDQYAESFLRKHGSFEPIEALLLFQQYVPPGKRVLDVGCGLGRDTDYLISHGYPYTVGLDMSIGMLSTGRIQGGFRFPAIQGDFRCLPFASGSFDAIWAAAAIIHLPRGEVVGVFREFRRLVGDGYIYLNVIKGKGERAEVGEKDRLKRGWRYFVFYEEQELRSLLAQAGLEKVLSWERPSQSRDPSQGPIRDWLHFIVRTT